MSLIAKGANETDKLRKWFTKEVMQFALDGQPFSPRPSRLSLG